MSREDPVIGREEDRRTTGSLEREQLACIGVHKYLRNARRSARACPDREGARETNLSVVAEDFLLAALEQVCNTPHSISGCNGSVWRKTKFARQIAAGRTEGENTRARQEMIERLFLYGIDAEPTRAAIAEELDPPGFRASHETQPTLPIAQLAGPRTHIALHPPIVQRVPVRGFDD